MHTDSERLDFVLGQMGWIRTMRADSGADTYWLETINEDENFIRLSGPGFYRTRREAVDAAMLAGGG